MQYLFGKQPQPQPQPQSIYNDILNHDFIQNFKRGPQQIVDGIKTTYNALNTYGDALTAPNKQQNKGLLGWFNGMTQAGVQGVRGTANLYSGLSGTAGGLVHLATSVIPTAAALYAASKALGKQKKQIQKIAKDTTKNQQYILNKMKAQKYKIPENQISNDFIQKVIGAKSRKRFKYDQQYQKLPQIHQLSKFPSQNIQDQLNIGKYENRKPGMMLAVQKTPHKPQLLSSTQLKNLIKQNNDEQN